LQYGRLEEIEDAMRTPLEEAVRLEERRLLREAIQSLTVPRDRELLTRRYLVDQDREEICEALGLEQRQFNKAASRARSRPRKLLEDVTHIRHR
jgi:RNA polymerase sigma factor (sigma-70 family)